MIAEHVVLVDEKNNVLGTADKDTVHSFNTPLHRGFSVFLFNKLGKLLLQQRSHKKKTFPGVWSNSCCGHPHVGEEVGQAAKRRLGDELGIEVEDFEVVLPDFRYKAEQDGLRENELCPVLVATTNQEPKINNEEVENTKWMSWEKFMIMVKKNDATLSSWAKEEARELNKNKKFRNLLLLK